MKSSNPTRRRIQCADAVLGIALAYLLAGCRGTLVEGEKEAREQAQQVTEQYRPDGQKPPLPVLGPDSALSDYLTYALLNQPRVEAAYFDWLASVERITVQRSLPDPQLTFQMDIQDVVTSIMPGLMMSFPGAGKLRAAGGVAAAESQAKYYAFKTASLESAYQLKRAYYQLYFLDEKIRVERENLVLLSDLEKLAQNLYISPPTLSQHAALACFQPETLGLLEARRTEFKARRDYLVPALRDLGFRIPVTPTGGFFVYADCSAFGMESERFCVEAHAATGVAFTPGVDFGRHRADAHVRFAYTIAQEKLREGIRRLAAWLPTLR
jgi:hypothetical protein